MTSFPKLTLSQIGDSRVRGKEVSRATFMGEDGLRIIFEFGPSTESTRTEVVDFAQRFWGKGGCIEVSIDMDESGAAAL